MNEDVEIPTDFWNLPLKRPQPKFDRIGAWDLLTLIDIYDSTFFTEKFWQMVDMGFKENKLEIIDERLCLKKGVAKP